jgi:ribosomal protein L16/L10AE
MGKGKGKPSNWAAKIPSGSIFIEFRNVRSGRAKHFMIQVIHKLPGSFKVISRYSNFLPLIAFKKNTTQYDYFF